MISDSFSRYKILDKIGEGGMGEVYRAEDTNLGRVVALKVLAPRIAGDPHSRERFHKEARAAASLNHPNICIVYDFNEADGRLFIAMELIEGTSLRQKLSAGPLPFELAVEYAQQAASALEAAHERSIVHRDIKAGNIMCCAGDRIKIVDFGLALLTEDADATRSMEIVGTPHYMAPEQLNGPHSDHRADLWSLGIVIYQMVTGKQPFPGKGASLIRSILFDDPVPAIQARPDLPYPFEQVILRALEKDPALRYQNAGALLTDLRTVRESLATPSTTQIIQSRETGGCVSVAVLPFVNINGDKDSDFFSDGLTDDLIDALTNHQELRVVSRTSAFQFRGEAHDPREVGRKLRVQVLVNGSLRRSGDRLRVTARLINVADGYQLWSQRFDREAQDVFQLQDELTGAIADNLLKRLVNKPEEPGASATDEATPRPPRSYSISPEAHELYLKGRYQLNHQTQPSLQAAIQLFEQAIALAPEYPLPWVGLAECCSLLGWYGIERPDAIYPKAEAAASRALELDPSLATAHSLLASIQAYFHWDWESSKQGFERALALGPGFAVIHFQHGLNYLTPLGQLEAAERQIRVAQTLDPLSLIITTALGGCLFRRRKYERAARQMREALDRDQNFYHAHWTMGRVLERQDRLEEALASLQRSNELNRNNPPILSDLGHCLARMGRTAEAKALLAQLNELGKTTYVSELNMAMIHLGLGDRQAFIAGLNQTLHERSPRLIWINVDPRVDPVREEPGFREILKQIGLWSENQGRP